MTFGFQLLKFVNNPTIKAARSFGKQQANVLGSLRFAMPTPGERKLDEHSTPSFDCREPRE
jgi:hypothetical protein